MSPCYNLDLENSKPNFVHALQLMVRHHNIKFGYKMLGSSEDIIWTNTDILTLHCDLNPEYSYPFFFHKTLWFMMMYHQTKFGCQGTNSSESIVERVIFFII